MMAIGIANTMESAPCIADAWSEEVSPPTISAALVLGMRDLPPDTLNRMVADAGACMQEDEQWWIDDIALELLDADDYSDNQAGCLATRFVETLGFEHALRLRILTLPLLTLSDAELAVLDPAACGAEVTLTPLIVGSNVGDCLANVLDPDLPITVVPCTGPHSGEVASVLDLGPVFDNWPGIQTIETTAADACIAKVEMLAVDHPEIGAAWGFPSREVWERGGRLSTCIIGKLDGTDWTGPSGIVV
jgi:Septum formation